MQFLVVLPPSQPHRSTSHIPLCTTSSHSALSPPNHVPTANEARLSERGNCKIEAGRIGVFGAKRSGRSQAHVALNQWRPMSSIPVATRGVNEVAVPAPGHVEAEKRLTPAQKIAVGGRKAIAHFLLPVYCHEPEYPSSHSARSALLMPSSRVTLSRASGRSHPHILSIRERANSFSFLHLIVFVNSTNTTPFSSHAAPH